LRLGRVSAGTDLGERIVYGDGKYQVAFYETRRWTEPPEKYVRDALEHSLFDEAGFRQAVAGPAPTLNIEILSFMEVKNGQTHLARVALRGVLSTNVELFAETFAVDQPVQGLLFEDVVAALSHALDQACRQIAVRVESALAAQAPVSEGPK
jgi:cholesterol transport system auxiliary component